MQEWLDKMILKRDNLILMDDDNDLIPLIFYLEIMLKFHTGLPKKGKKYLKEQILNFYNVEIDSMIKELKEEKRIAGRIQEMQDGLEEELIKGETNE